jgi:hypothetical protein
VSDAQLVGSLQHFHIRVIKDSIRIECGTRLSIRSFIKDLQSGSYEVEFNRTVLLKDSQSSGEK